MRLVNFELISIGPGMVDTTIMWLSQIDEAAELWRQNGRVDGSLAEAIDEDGLYLAFWGDKYPQNFIIQKHHVKVRNVGFKYRIPGKEAYCGSILEMRGTLWHAFCWLLARLLDM